MLDNYALNYPGSKYYKNKGNVLQLITVLLINLKYFSSLKDKST